jgi:hypothetical protein
VGATMSGRRIAAIGLVLAAVATATAFAWFVLSRPLPLPSPEHAASIPVPTMETPPPQEAAPAPPFTARRRKPPPPPYLPPYEKPQGPLLVDLLRAPRREIEIHFPRLFGRVVSAADEAPIRDAVIGVPNEFDSGREFEKHVLDVDDVRAVTRTDGDGRFELDESVVGSVMMVRSSGFGQQLLDRAWLGPAHEAPFVIELAPAAKLDVRVSNRVGSPMAGVEIRLIANAYESTPRSDLPHKGIISLLVGAHRVTDDNGQATFAQLPADVPFDAELWSAQTLLVRDPDELVLEAGKVNSREWHLGAGSTVTGRVVDDAGQPVGGTTLWLTQHLVPETSSVRRTSWGWFDRDKIARKCCTDAEGGFTIENVTPGRWWLGVAPSMQRITHPALVVEDAIAPVAEAFDVDPQGDTVNLLLRVNRGLYIRGEAIDGDGEPVLAAILAKLSSADEAFVADATTYRATGQFVLGPLEPGDYSIQADPSSMERTAGGRFVPGKPLLPIKSLIVAAGRDDVVLKFDRGATIQAKAVRADTGVDAPATFVLAHANGSEAWHTTGFESSSSALFCDIEPGDYSLSVVTSDGRAGCVPELHVAEGQVLDSVVVRVDPGARLKLTYEGTSEEYANVTILAGGTVYGEDGIKRKTSATFVAPAGTVTVRWAAGDDRFEEKVDLSVGETRELVWPPTKGDEPTDRGH